MNEFIIFILDVASNVCRDVVLSRRRGVLLSERTSRKVSLESGCWHGLVNQTCFP